MVADGHRRLYVNACSSRTPLPEGRFSTHPLQHRSMPRTRRGGSQVLGPEDRQNFSPDRKVRVIAPPPQSPGWGDRTRRGTNTPMKALRDQPIRNACPCFSFGFRIGRYNICLIKSSLNRTNWREQPLPGPSIQLAGRAIHDTARSDQRAHRTDRFARPYIARRLLVRSRPT
jgi:hypothetical protein